MLTLPLSALRTANACGLDDRIATFRAHHGRDPDDCTTLRDWLAVTPDVHNWIWATRCLGAPGRILALTVATRAARRALNAAGWDHVADPRPLRAVDAAEVVLEAWRSGAGPDAARRADAADAADAAYTAATDAAYAARAAYAADAYAAYAAYAAADAARAADAAYAADAADAECAAQRADFLAVLDEIEGR